LREEGWRGEGGEEAEEEKDVKDLDLMNFVVGDTKLNPFTLDNIMTSKIIIMAAISDYMSV